MGKTGTRTRRLSARRFFVGVGEVHLVRRDDVALAGQFAAVEPKLLADGAVGGDRVRPGERGDVHDVADHARALDVAEELVAESVPGVRALDQPGQVGDDERPRVAHVGDAELRLERGERIGCDFRMRGAHAAQQRRLSRVRQPDQADVGDQLELQVGGPLLAGLALLPLARRAVDGGGEVLVPESALAAARDADDGARLDEVAQDHAGGRVAHGRAGRNVERQVFPVLAGAVAAAALAAVARGIDRARREIQQRRHVRVRAQEDGAAVAAVAAVRPAALDVLLPPERAAAVAAFSAADAQTRLVNEHFRPSRKDRYIGNTGHDSGSKRRRSTGLLARRLAARYDARPGAGLFRRDCRPVNRTRAASSASRET